MSHPEHEERRTLRPDDAVADLWREVSAESPPPHVDARILAAAREAAARQDTDSQRVRAIEPRSRARWTWRPLLAAAAVAGITFAIVPPLLRQADGPVPPRAERGANAPAAEQPMQPERDAETPAPSQLESSAAAAPASVPVERESRAPDATEAAPAVKSAESAGPVVSEDAEAHDQPHPVAAPAPAPPAATAEAPNAGEPVAVTGGSGALARADRALPSAPAALSKSPALDTPTDRAAKIASLYESGDVTAAAAELRAFRATRSDADTYLPGTLQDWARTVK
jgi:cytoskeletal protein RodZ